MDYSIYLPSHFSSWYEFYESEKPRFTEDQEDIYITAYPRGVFPASMAQIETYRYSVQYIKNQTLEELYALRKLQTFDVEELRHIYYALQLNANTNADSSNSVLKILQVKVAQLLHSLKKKERLGL